MKGLFIDTGLDRVPDEEPLGFDLVYGSPTYTTPVTSEVKFVQRKGLKARVPGQEPRGGCFKTGSIRHQNFR